MTNKEQNDDPAAGITSSSYVDGVEQTPAKGVDNSKRGDGQNSSQGTVENSGAAGRAIKDKEAAKESVKEADGSTAESEQEDEKPEEEQDDTADDESAKESAKPKKSVQARFNELTRAKYDAERERDDFKRRLEALESGTKPAKGELTPDSKGGKDQPSDRPKPSDAKYQYGELDPQYIADVTQYEVKKALAADRAEQEKVRQSEAAAAEQRERADKARQASEVGREKYDDFDDVVLASPLIMEQMPELVEAFVLDSDVGHDLAYHLASNPKETRALYGKTPFEQIRALGRLEAQFSSAQDAPKKPVKQTQAPDPVKQPRGAGGKFSAGYDAEDFSAVEAKWQDEQKRRG